MTTPSIAPATPARRFGTFAGVYTPSVLTILGVVLYMRLGWVTGSVGLGNAWLIIIVAHLISLATGLSVASIATNRRVGAGGAYFMISRALGASTGAAVGIPLFFAQALSVTFYIVGFAESVHQLLPATWRAYVSEIAIGTATNILLTGLSLKSAALAIRMQYGVMAAIVASFVAFFSGTTDEFARPIEWFRQDGEPFAHVFAMFFPAVTGIMAGVSMSGDLSDSRRAIPRGTLWAIATGFVFYMAFPLWLSLNRSNSFLVAHKDAVFTIASLSALIYAGVWGATLSSAIGSLLTAPRTLQALAMDGLAPRLFARGHGPSNEPRLGIALTFILAQVGVVLGSLDAIAPVLTMFLLATYGVTNVACGLERWAASPSFRPSFKVPWVVSLGGGFACFYVMSVIDMFAMAASLLFCVGIFALTQRRSLGTTYGDARHGIWAALVRSALYRLRRLPFHPLNWRPNLIILGGSPDKRGYMLQLGSAIVQDRGVVTYFELLRGAVEKFALERRKLLEANDSALAEDFPHVFYRVDVVDDVYRGTVAAAQSYGIGTFEANCVMLGWPKKKERGQAYAQMLRDLVRLDRSLLLVRYDEARALGRYRRIHIWWGGPHRNGGLMLLIAYLLTAHDRWRQAQVRVLTVVKSAADRQVAEQRLRDLLRHARLDADVRIVLREERSLETIMRHESAQADLAIVGFRLPSLRDPADAFYERMQSLLQHLPTTILVHSARNFQGGPVLFDD